MEKQISIIGGDNRIIKFAQMMKKDGFNISIFGLENSTQIESFEICNSIEEVTSKSNIIISAIPLSKDGEKINTPYSDKKILIKD